MDSKNNKISNMVEKLLEADVHLGRRKSVGHPSMRPYIFTTRQDVQILNLEETEKKLNEAAEFLKGVVSKGGVVVVVSTVMPAKILVKQIAEDLKIPFVADRWIGGTLTNFKVISKRIKHFLNLSERKKKGELSKYTKKEQIGFDKEIADLEKKIGGIATLDRRPDAILVVNAPEHQTALREASKMGIPVVAVSNTDTNTELIDYVIPANDKSVKSVKFILEYLRDAMKAKEVDNS